MARANVYRWDDAVYPFCFSREQRPGGLRYAIEVPDETLERWDAAEAAWEAVQEEMKVYAKQQHDSIEASERQLKAEALALLTPEQRRLLGVR